MLIQNEVRKDFLRAVPSDLPVPMDDGTCRHLEGLALPSVELSSTAGGTVNPSRLLGWVVLYCYPMTGRPGMVIIPDGWLQIPGAAGCTPQSCSFRDPYRELQTLHAQVFGIITQTTEDQREAAERLHLPFDLSSDTLYLFTRELRLPTFEIDGMRYLKRVTLIAKDGEIRRCIYPMFPPDKNIHEVIAWLRQSGP